MLRLLILFITLAAITVETDHAIADEAQTPSLEFLEYLGEWESSDGQWQDPIEFSTIDVTELQNAESKLASEEQNNDK
jgi:hypothetical protein